MILDYITSLTQLFQNYLRNKMFTEYLFMLAFVLILMGLVNSTEMVLAVRHRQREEGKELIVYL